MKKVLLVVCVFALTLAGCHTQKNYYVFKTIKHTQHDNEAKEEVVVEEVAVIEENVNDQNVLTSLPIEEEVNFSTEPKTEAVEEVTTKRKIHSEKVEKAEPFQISTTPAEQNFLNSYEELVSELEKGKKATNPKVIAKGLKVKKALKKLRKEKSDEEIVEEFAKGEKSQLIALILAILIGGLGIHRFYLGYTTIGIVQLLTAGGCGVWALIDIVRIAMGDLQPMDGPYDETL